MASYLHDRFPALADALPRLELCSRPTPVRPLAALSARAGAELWVKDDGASAPLWGGNKPRKLEWVLADALRRRRRWVLTFGGLATNHGLATARYARRHGLRCALALVEQPRDEHVEAQLARLRADADAIHYTRSSRRTMLLLPWLLARHAQLRPPRPPYVLPPGGSSPLGAIGFAEAALELAAQVEAGELPEPAEVVVALGSGGSAAGLLAGLGLTPLRTRVVAVLVNDQLRLDEATVTRLARRALRLLRSRGADVDPRRLGAGGVEVVTGFMGAGYGHRTAEAEAAIAAAREDGLALDPVYTGKAMAALLARAEAARGPVLYWHTHSAVGH